MESSFSSLLNSIVESDHSIFEWINQSTTNPVFDAIMPIITDLHTFPLFWLALISLAAVLLFRTASPLDRNILLKKIGYFILVTGLSMALADMIAYRAIKVYVQRPRPEAAGLTVTLRTHSHSGWSFPSNHSANMFALARSIQLIAPAASLPIAGAYAFASTVAFSRVYVGVHFPGDTLAGGTIGWLCATFVHFALGRLRRSRRSKSV